MNNLQTILGAGGAIGRSLAQELRHYTDTVRLVSRNPSKILPTDEVLSANLTSRTETEKAVQGSRVVYLTAGLPYNLNVWKEQWPVIMQNTISACLKYNALLVFFDNIYMYNGNDLSNIHEELPIDPPSKKGEVRANLIRQLQEAHAEQGLNFVIARAADFYGPGIKQVSLLQETIITPLSQGKPANLLGRADVPHSYTYVPDAARATALLGNSLTAVNQVWHLPTAQNPPTQAEWVKMSAELLHTQPKFRTAGKGLLTVMGLFVPVLSEMREMLYQYDRPYIFNSNKFEQTFNSAATPYAAGLEATIEAFLLQK